MLAISLGFGDEILNLTVGLATYVPSCSCFSRFIVRSIPFNTYPAVLSFHITPFLHFIMDSYNASNPITFSISNPMLLAKLAPQSHSHHEIIVWHIAGSSAPCVSVVWHICAMRGLYSLCSDTIRTAPIRVRGVVVVGVACGVDIPSVVRVATIR